MSCSDSNENFTGPWWRFPPLRNALIAGLIALPAWILALTGLIDSTFENMLYWIAIPIGAWFWVQEGIETLYEEHEIGISILMIAATTGAGILGMWEEAAALVVLYSAAEGVEEFAFARTRTAIRALLDLAPKEARVIRNDEELLIPAEELKVGDLFIVRPGESLPTDGKIVSGTSSLDESPVTGESVPVDKGPGMKVFAASINGQGALSIEANKTFADNTLSRIIKLVEEAQDQKGRAQQWMEKFGRRYSPAVLLASALMVLIPWLASADMLFWAERAVVLLVAAAPCALIISLPITMAAGIAGAGKHGILIKGGAHLEHLGIIDIIAFDKTGTLTYGKPRVTDLISSDDKNNSNLIALAYGMERNSEHPLAHAIRNYGNDRGIAPVKVSGFSALTGSGIQADWNGTTWYMGKPDLFLEMGQDISQFEDQISSLQNEGKTVVLVGSKTELQGLIAMQDILRDNVAQAIQSLHKQGIRTVMLTGDNIRTAKRIAEQVGVDDVRADLRPEDKVDAIRKLLTQGKVLMIGDGVNDAPALATATCGVAMGAAGTDAAIESADVVLMADDLNKLVEVMQLGRKARKVSRQNIIFSITVLALLIPLGVTGMISIAFTVLVHEASELLAVANGLRAGKITGKIENT
ncbi:MAG TPA: cation-translocating P-type ATPase [Gammaproteobacteria bacterium]|nr:putative cadmium-transporting ATPase [bacterium BMS3Abin11]GMT40124.1 MAG: cadmium transporter ATPase [bacterium]HDH08965.1 cation-translocating P-type ATPase [Gammaproteobacteria bacterium]HDH16806.1 cation-translocating P-type ATPase [Gammaproteobacteria bacterium]HDZ78517.1 cation-translocating P-type ATPase [Gammaproteobacteria bacterium]